MGRGPATGGLGGGSLRVGSRYCAHEATMRAACPGVKPVMHGSTLRAARIAHRSTLSIVDVRDASSSTCGGEPSAPPYVYGHNIAHSSPVA